VGTRAKVASSVEVLPVAEVEWEQLNPARGDRSPQAGTLWGDRNGAVPTGFLVRFADGFSSPPHIHNTNYRAVVISGLIHNNHPLAVKRWMPAGSFWTQPKGQVHITAAQGDNTVALVEIDEGPYLVQPPDERVEIKEKPILVAASNVAWGTPAGMNPKPGGIRLAHLWGNIKDDQANGSFLKLPSGFKGTINSRGSTFRAVVILGAVNHIDGGAKQLNAGSYFGSTGEAVHKIAALPDEDTILYIRTDGRYDISQAPAP
jgi:quercetin dioxygenase-like cupin family protein